MQNSIYHIFNKIFMNKVENEILSYVKNKKVKTIFDVGCFRGTFTKNIINNENKNEVKSKIYLFDPNPNVEKYLGSLLNQKNIKYFNIAFDNSNTIKTFTINQYFEASGSSLNSLHQKDKLYNLSRKTFMKIFQPFSKVKDYLQVNVKTQELDKFCDKNKIYYLDLLKLDTEGNEFNILKGAEKLLSKNKINVIYTEICSTKQNYPDKLKKIKNYLSNYNFEHVKSYNIPTLSLFSKLKASDELFVNNK